MAKILSGDTKGAVTAGELLVNTINTINKKKKEAKKKNYDHDTSTIRKPGHFYSLATGENKNIFSCLKDI